MCVNSRSVRFGPNSSSLLGTGLSRTKLPWKSLYKKKVEKGLKVGKKADLHDLFEGLVPSGYSLRNTAIANI